MDTRKGAKQTRQTQGSHITGSGDEPRRLRRLVLDEDAAAELLGVSPRTLQRWRQEGRGPAFVRIGKRRMYREKDLEAFVEAGVVHS